MATVVMLEMHSIIALFFVVLIGLPHGAFDGAVAVYLGVGQTIRSLLVLRSYCLLAAVVILFWMQFPAAMLIAFLLISAVHFGWGDATSNNRLGFAIQVAIHGAIPVFGIAVFHADEVRSLFNQSVTVVRHLHYSWHI